MTMHGSPRLDAVNGKSWPGFRREASSSGGGDDVRGGPIPDCAHYVHEQQPAATVEAITRFANELGLA